MFRFFRVIQYKKYFAIRNLFIFLNDRLYFFIAGHECILKRSLLNIPNATTVIGVKLGRDATYLQKGKYDVNCILPKLTTC